MSAKDDIIIKTPQQIENIRISGKYLNELLHKVANASKAGVSLIELEFIAEDFMKKNNVKGAFKNYQWFPANLCLSVNDCVVHGIPDRYVLKNWDVLKIDCGIVYEKGISDSAVTVIIWWEAANPLGYQLSKITKEWLDIAIKHIWPGKMLFDYAQAINTYVTNKWFSIIKKLTGHGVGIKVHEKPYIYNCPHPDTKKIAFRPGMVVAIEPITAITSTDFVMKPISDWNLYCKNGDIGAHWEYTLLITETGYEILSWITDDAWFFE